MDTHSTPVPIADLLAHQDWLRRLAGALVRDAHEADDLVQETMLTALQSPPESNANARNWLAVVLRNTLRSFRRSSQRRHERERATARNEALPATLEALALASMQHHLVEHVLALDDRTREVILLRFFADMPPRVIATELDRPLLSVKKSLQRGLVELRGRLDAERGGRAEWLALLIPFAGPAPFASATKVWISAAALVLMGSAVWLVVRSSDGAQRTPVTSSSMSPAPADARESVGNALPVGDLADASASIRRESLVTPKSAQTTSGPPTPGSEITRVRFVDLDATPLANFRVRRVDRERLRWSDATETVIIGANFWLEVSPQEREQLRASPEALDRFLATHSVDAALGRALILGTPLVEPVFVADANGELSVDFARSRESLVAQDPQDFAPVAVGRTRRDRLENQRTYVFAAARELRGRLLDDAGSGVAQMTVGIHFSAAWLAGLPPGSFDDSPLDKLTARTDDEGHFVFACVPRIGIRGFTFESGQRTQLVERAVELGELDSGSEIVLMTKANESRVTVKSFVGRVVRADGSLARHARLADSTRSIEADTEGRFEWTGAVGGSLWAFERSYGYARFDGEPVARAGDGEDIRIVLANPVGSIEGVVLDDRRLPLEGIDVSILDEAWVGPMNRSIEAYLSGARSLRVTTDQAGRFRFDGLLEREYTLSAVHGMQSSEPIRASPSSRPVIIDLPTAERFERVRGRVLTIDGEPIANFTVSVVPHAEASRRASVRSNTIRRNAGLVGEFELGAFECSRPMLVVAADGYMPRTLLLDRNATDGSLEVRLAPACRVLVAFPATTAGDQLCVRDGANQELDILPAPNSPVASPTRLKVTAQTLSPFLVSSHASEVVLMRGAEIVSRLSVRLDPDKLTRVDF